MICFPNAKINIGLNITEKRADGFHNIETVMYPLKEIVFDALEVIQGSGKEVEVKGSGIRIPGDNKDNLCVKAYHLIKKDHPRLPDINIYLHKVIPIGAGLGGGSADAAFFIRLLNDVFELGISWGELHHYARQLGSDCSFFVSNRPAFAQGKGDQLESIQLDLSRYYIVLVCPDIHINTALAYSGVKPKKPMRSLEEDIQKLPISQWKKYISNDFEDSVFPKYPELKKIKEKLYVLGATYASMSGSGSALFGIFK
ncbi:MAG: 4-(cytidine 5'-diphospho)-2-C-methyl-D-erythritol kinase, partial [Phycisphaeraceae bacterium]|nr:4-(cytidine 5'-diphospho)-2-C-methyl-D-erythritol kinase [Phycisphaeraceae bacterium]